MSNLNTTIEEIVPLLQRLQALRSAYLDAPNTEKATMEQEFEETKVKLLTAQKRLQTIMESMTLDTNVMSFFEASYPNYKKGIQNLGLLTVEESMGQVPSQAANSRNNNNNNNNNPNIITRNNQSRILNNRPVNNEPMNNQTMNSRPINNARRRNGNGNAMNVNNSVSAPITTPPNTGGPVATNGNALPRTTGGKRRGARKTQRRRTTRRK
jgi:hypothetical protein